MLLSNEVHYFKQKIVIVFLVVLAYLPHVITNIVPNANDLSKQNTSMKKVPFVEYYIEHNVSEGAAKQSFFEVGVKLIDDKPMAWCPKCTEDILNYCYSRSLLDDHCCCDSRHGKEQIPWIPHSCYVGVQEKCSPSTGSCITHTELRQCCCDRVLAKRWKSIYSSSMMTTANVLTVLVCVVMLIISRPLN